MALRRITLAIVCLAVFAHGREIPKANICNIHCDGRDASLAAGRRVPVTVDLFGRHFELIISDQDDMGFARVSNGNPGDEVWLDRTFDGGNSWSADSRIGNKAIAAGAREATTVMFNFDEPNNNFRLGALRACGKAGDRTEIVCTAWARSTVHAGSRIEAAANALMQYYNNNGLWTTAGWWNSANCLTAIIDYMRQTGDRTYLYAIGTTFDKNRGAQWGDFTNEYIDDVGWWGLAWVDAYDLTGEARYLQMAQTDADFMYGYRDDKCGGGLWWSADRNYKNAIPNELFIKLAASLHNRIPGDTKYLQRAVEVVEWFERSGMINSEGLVNDGLTDDCRNNGRDTWTYNQGVILGGYVQLQQATGNSQYITKARNLADAVLRSPNLNPNNILREPCEPGGGECGGDASSFKGIFIRNLGELNRALGDRPYSQYLRNLADTIYSRDRNSLDQYGVHWAGPFTIASAPNQHGGLEVHTAAL